MSKVRKSLITQLNNFFKEEFFGGILIIFTVLLTMIVANCSTAEWYQSFVNTPINIRIGGNTLNEPLKMWVKDVLMVFFFMLVSMELKCEILEGFLSTKKQILLPFFAALGGMIAPALIFLLINYNSPEYWRGWAIPAATDIAFALCILMLSGKRVPPALKTFLLAIAIFDDLGIIAIIAFFYNGKMALLPMLLVFAGCLALFALNRLRIMTISVYIALGIVLWFLVYQSGIHTTIAGVMVGMAIPLRNPNNSTNSPLKACMHFLHPWVSFFILPLFAFTSSGINLHGTNFQTFLDPLVLSVTFALFFGKQIGIFGTTWLVIKSGFSKLPEGTNWRQIHAISIIAGIGFTMSLFIGMLAFKSAILQEHVKLGVILGSVLASIFGWIAMRRVIS